MSIDLGNNPTGTPPTTAEQGYIRDALGIGTGDNVNFNKVGIGLGATGPVAALDIQGNQMCLRESFTPSPGASAFTGTICWDNGNLYVQTGASGWKYAALTGPIASASGSTGLIDGGPVGEGGATGVPLEYIPFLATYEQLNIRVEVVGATGVPGAVSQVVLGSQYTPFEYAIIEGDSIATIDNPSVDNIVWNSTPLVGDYVVVSLKVGSTYLSSFGPTDTLTPGNTLSGAYAKSSGFDCAITFTVLSRT